MPAIARSYTTFGKWHSGGALAPPSALALRRHIGEAVTSDDPKAVVEVVRAPSHHRIRDGPSVAEEGRPSRHSGDAVPKVEEAAAGRANARTRPEG